MDQDAPVPATSPPTQPLSNGTANGDSTRQNGTDAHAGPSTGTMNGGMASANNTQGPSDPETPDMHAMLAQRREEEMARRDRSLAEFLVMLDGYKPLVSIVPDSFSRSGLGVKMTCQVLMRRYRKRSQNITFNEQALNVQIHGCTSRLIVMLPAAQYTRVADNVESASYPCQPRNSSRTSPATRTTLQSCA